MATERRLREFGIPLLPPGPTKAVDAALTGCGGVSSSKDVVKGGKGAVLLREKLVRAAARANAGLNLFAKRNSKKRKAGLDARLSVATEAAPDFSREHCGGSHKLTGADAA